MNQNYHSEIIASTDIHAGENLFGFLFRKILRFDENGKVTLEKKVIDQFRAIDPSHLKHIDSYKIEGEWSKSENDLIKISFEEIYLKMIGATTKEERIVFHCMDTRLSRQWGETYSLNTT
ncbi:MAG: hypothetical protein Crog4KO_07520 [Crocinitomicaceae bacterium]